MNKLILATAAASLLLGGAGAASAQWRDQNRNDQQNYDRGSDHSDNNRSDNNRSDSGRSDYSRSDSGHSDYGRGGYGHSDYGRHDAWRGHGWNSSWRRGGRIDRDYWSRGSYVDWRVHRLRQPPRGYEWRYVDGRYVMAAVASGIIADIIMNSR